MHLLSKIRHLHPALFGSYDTNGFTAASGGLQPHHLPLVTLGAGMVTPPNERYYRGVSMGTPSAVPGFTLRIGGDPDTTDEHLKAIVHMLRGNRAGTGTESQENHEPYGGPQIPGAPIRGMRR